MQINKEGIELIKKYESLKLEPYTTSKGNLLIGYRHIIKENEKFDKISKITAEEILIKDLKYYETVISKLIEIELNINQFSALVSFCHNLGTKVFQRSSLLQTINRKDHLMVPAQFLRFVNINSQPTYFLMKRRLEEAMLYIS